MKIAVELDHEKALAAYVAAGNSFPTIPKGSNTVYYHFEKVGGGRAVIVNQRDFRPELEDNEEQVNGCLLAVAIGPEGSETAISTLENWVREMLEL